MAKFQSSLGNGVGSSEKIKPQKLNHDIHRPKIFPINIEKNVKDKDYNLYFWELNGLQVYIWTNMNSLHLQMFCIVKFSNSKFGPFVIERGFLCVLSVNAVFFLLSYYFGKIVTFLLNKLSLWKRALLLIDWNLVWMIFSAWSGWNWNIYFDGKNFKCRLCISTISISSPLRKRRGHLFEQTPKTFCAKWSWNLSSAS